MINICEPTYNTYAEMHNVIDIKAIVISVSNRAGLRNKRINFYVHSVVGLTIIVRREYQTRE